MSQRAVPRHAEFLVCSFLLASLAGSLAASSARAVSGSAGGEVCIYPNGTQALGFSAYSGQWSATILDSEPQRTAIGTYLGYIRTGAKVYAFNSLTGNWYRYTYQDPPSGYDGEDVEGATAIYWGCCSAYGIATTFVIWRPITFLAGEYCYGGGSAGTFGLAWTNQRAHAYNANTGQWQSQVLSGPALGGIASSGLGLVWTANSAYAFDPLSNAWEELSLGNPNGVSASGSGNVGLVWSDDTAQAYSAPLDLWVPLSGYGGFNGGEAGGDVGLLWADNYVFSFTASTGLWSVVALSEPSATQESDGGVPGTFSLGPNPSLDGRVTLRLPGADRWLVSIFDVSGARVRSLERTASASELIEWDGRNDTGQPVSAGSYWIQAENASGRTEARRVVIQR